jgi:hypothetical protein
LDISGYRATRQSGGLGRRTFVATFVEAVPGLGQGADKGSDEGGDEGRMDTQQKTSKLQGQTSGLPVAAAPASLAQLELIAMCLGSQRR